MTAWGKTESVDNKANIVGLSPEGKVAACIGFFYTMSTRLEQSRVAANAFA